MLTISSHCLEPTVSSCRSSVSESSILASCVALVGQVGYAAPRIPGALDDVHYVPTREFSTAATGERHPAQSATLDPGREQWRAHTTAQTITRSSIDRCRGSHSADDAVRACGDDASGGGCAKINHRHAVVVAGGRFGDGDGLVRGRMGQDVELLLVDFGLAYRRVGQVVIVVEGVVGKIGRAHGQGPSDSGRVFICWDRPAFYGRGGGGGI